MRKLLLTLAALAAFGIALPVVTSSPSDAREVVVIKKHRHWDRGHHYGWHRHHRDAVVVR